MDPTKKVAPCGMVVMVPMVNGLLTRTLLISTRPRRGMDATVIRFAEERQTYIPTELEIYAFLVVSFCL